MASFAESDLPLGKETEYVTTYMPSLLRSIDRCEGRSQLGITGDALPFMGEDLWTCYELSWLDPNGRPFVAIVDFRVPCGSPALVESKSLKLYLNSFAQTEFKNRTEVLSTLDSDLGLAFRAPVVVSLIDVDSTQDEARRFAGSCIDDLPIAVKAYEPDASLLDVTVGATVREVVYTHLFRTICPITGQPDMASVLIEYVGPRISRESLLAYLVSYRVHESFHEQAIEQVFCELKEAVELERLTVYGRFMRRGGIDINPFRSTHAQVAPTMRLYRQ